MVKNGDRIMLTTEQIEKIIKSESNRIGSFIKTIKYVHRSASSGKIKEILDMNMAKDPSAIRSLGWELIKYFVVTNEIISIRNKLMHMIFNEYANVLEDNDLKNLIRNPSNQWLDDNYKKIELFIYFIDEWLNNPNVCEKVCCMGNGSKEAYYLQRKYVIETLDFIKANSFKTYMTTEIEKIKNDKERVMEGYLSLSTVEGNRRRELYCEVFQNTALLEMEEEDGTNG